MRKIVTNMVLLLGLVSGLLAQPWVVFSPEVTLNHQPFLMDSLFYGANFYRQFSNIAGLFNDRNSQELLFGNRLAYTTGEYRRPFDPGIVNNQDYAVQITKPLSEKDLFKGYFGYHRRVDTSVKWLHQSRRVDWVPFLLADSSTGRFELNGLYWSGEWAHRLNRQMTTGLGMYYNVDKALKQNFPKPETNHRDIHVRLGFQMQLKHWQFGLQGRYFDEQEIVKITRYNLDQNLTPVLYKFRFSDLPMILTGKTSEERQVNYHGQEIGFHLSRPIGSHWQLLMGVEGTHSLGNIQDGGSQPIPQGQFRWLQGRVKLVLHQLPSRKMQFRFTYANQFDDFTADHPEFAFRILQQQAFVQQLVGSIRYRYPNRTRLFLDLGAEQGWMQYQDLMTANYFQYRHLRLILRAGGSAFFSNRQEIRLWSGLTRIFTYDIRRTANRYSEFFDILFTQRWDYYQNQTGSFLQGVNYVYHYYPLLEFTASIQFRQTLSDQSAWEFQSRQNWILNLWVKFFIF